MFKTTKSNNSIQAVTQANAHNNSSAARLQLVKLMTNGHYSAMRMIYTYETVSANNFDAAYELKTYANEHIDIEAAVTAIQAAKCKLHFNYSYLTHLTDYLDAIEAEGESRQQAALKYWLTNCARENFTYYCVFFISEYMFTEKHDSLTKNFSDVMREIRNADGSFTYFKNTAHEVTVS